MLALILIVVAGVVLILLSKPPVVQETFTTKALDQARKDLVGRKVAVVKTMPASADPSTVYIQVDARNMLVRNPVIPYEGLPANRVVSVFQKKFGLSWVTTDTQDRASSDKVVVVHNPRTQLTTKVHVPSRWSIAPRQLALMDGKTRPFVAVNPSTGFRAQGKTVVLKTNAQGVATVVELRG